MKDLNTTLIKCPGCGDNIEIKPGSSEYICSNCNYRAEITDNNYKNDKDYLEDITLLKKYIEEDNITEARKFVDECLIKYPTSEELIKYKEDLIQPKLSPKELMLSFVIFLCIIITFMIMAITLIKV